MHWGWSRQHWGGRVDGLGRSVLRPCAFAAFGKYLGEAIFLRPLGQISHKTTHLHAHSLEIENHGLSPVPEATLARASQARATGGLRPNGGEIRDGYPSGRHRSTHL